MKIEVFIKGKGSSETYEFKSEPELGEILTFADGGERRRYQVMHRSGLVIGGSASQPISIRVEEVKDK